MEDKKLKRVGKATMYLTCIEMTLLTIALSITLVVVLRKMKFKFPVILLILLIMADVSSFILAWGLHAENTEYHEEHAELLSQVIGWTTFGFNFGANCMHWLFSLKYWVIAREVPKLFKGGSVSFNERLYTFINIMGIIINLIPCILLGYARGLLTFKSSGQVPPTAILDWVKGLYHLVTGLMLISAIVLGDALRRIVISLKNNPILKTNYRIMWLHITMLSVHVIVFLLAEFFVFRAMANPTTKNLLLQSYSRMALFTS